MTSPVASSNYSQGFGTSTSETPVVASTAPAATNILGINGPFKIGQKWINSSSNDTYTLTSFSVFNGVMFANWTQEGGSGGGGNVTSVTGTANEITAAPTTGNVVLSIPSNFVAPGSITATTTLTASSGDITASNGNLVLSTQGTKLVLPIGINGAVGIGTLNSGTVTISNSCVSASSIILVSYFTPGSGALVNTGALSVTDRSPGTFTVTSTNGGDGNTFAWLIIR